MPSLSTVFRLLPATAPAAHYADLSNTRVPGRTLVTIDLRRAIGDRAHLIPVLLVLHFLVFTVLAALVVLDSQALNDADQQKLVEQFIENLGGAL